MRFLLLLTLLTTQICAQSPMTWQFPLPRTHTGILLGNGTQGLMVWGEGRQLNVTVARAGFWDHRGGNDFSTRIDFDGLRKLLEAKDGEAVKAAFAGTRRTDKPNFNRPQQLGGGRFEITLPEGWTLEQGSLQMTSGTIQITVRNDQKTANISIQQAIDKELAWIDWPKTLSAAQVRWRPAYEFSKDQLAKVGIAAPESWQQAGVEGSTQSLPEDPALTVAWQKNPTQLSIATCLGKDHQERTTALLRSNLKELDRARRTWWRDYWATAPKVTLPDPILQELHDYGLYKLACTSPPQGVACTLQGPFMEEYQVVPWSNDYHFNINVQMIYYPALMTGKFEHLRPLWDMIDSWMPVLRQNGEAFFKRPDALMLPHAVDDQCRVVGTFWTGTIDHACTAWMGQLAWLHYRYSGDTAILRRYAYPLLVGAYEGYRAMLEEVTDANGKKRWSLPVSVSPEYRGAQMDAWGRDASFQLAALHSVLQLLPQAAKLLNKPINPDWADVAQRLPPYTTIESIYQQEWNSKNTRIALWEGMDLVESHRHHSHLAAIYPFVTIDPYDPAHQSTVQASLQTWRYRGAGGWSGWCVPWAAVLLARTGQTEGAVQWLHYFNDNFTNEGRGTLHNANSNGHSIIGAPQWSKQPGTPNREVMQLDGGMGALTAVYELLVQNRRNGLHVLPDLSVRWRQLQFERVRAEGGFEVSAVVKQGQIQQIDIRSTLGGELVLHHNMGEQIKVNGQPYAGKVLRRSCVKGEALVLSK